MTDPPDANGWIEYRRLIIGELERLNRVLIGLDLKLDLLREQDIAQMKVEIAMLKTRAGVLGAVAGAIGGLVLSALISKWIK